MVCSSNGVLPLLSVSAGASFSPIFKMLLPGSSGRNIEGRSLEFEFGLHVCSAVPTLDVRVTAGATTRSISASSTDTFPTNLVLDVGAFSAQVFLDVGVVKTGNELSVSLRTKVRSSVY
jgi:hypothetical protein